VIYFAQANKGGPVKIGCTSNMELRRRTLEAHYGRKLELLATMEGGFPREMEIHKMFAHIRLGRTELFRPERELFEFIGRPELASADPGAVDVMPGNKILAIRSTGEWAQWLERGARHCRTDIAKLVDAAVAEYLAEKGFKEPPPERIP
jgi:hypothetical protein